MYWKKNNVYEEREILYKNVCIFLQALVLDLQGEGVNFDNLWSGPGIPFGGSLIMMTLDIILYACLAYYFDCVIPSMLYF